MANKTVYMCGYGRRNKGKYRPFADFFNPRGIGGLRTFSHAIEVNMSKNTKQFYQGKNVNKR